MKTGFCLFFAIAFSATAWTQLRVAGAFSDNMVLQRDKPVRIFGKGIPDKKVFATFDKDTLQAVVQKDSTWQVVFKPRAANFTGQEITLSSGRTTITLNNILIGDVWFCAGQSNMEFPLAGEEHLGAALKTAHNPNLRLLNFKKRLTTYNPPYQMAQLPGLYPENFYKGVWVVADSTTVPDFSAVAYYFGYAIQHKAKAPIGLINVSVGGSPTEAWIHPEMVQGDTGLLKIFKGNWMENPLLDPWCILRGHQNLDSLIQDKAPIPKDELGFNHPFKPAFLYKAAIEPFSKVAIKGVIWYQGESNALSLWRARQHEKMFPLLIAGWRGIWGPDLPFYFCQLSSISTEKGYKSEHWGYFRDSQRRIADRLPNVGMAVTSDIGHPFDVHPKDKKTVGERLAKIALHKTYQEKTPFEGPKPLQLVQKPGQISVLFNDKLRLSEGKTLKGVAIETSEGVIQNVPAILAKRKIIIKTALKPKRVLYGWEPYSAGNLTNKAGLPCSTFALELQGGKTL